MGQNRSGDGLKLRTLFCCYFVPCLEREEYQDFQNKGDGVVVVFKRIETDIRSCISSCLLGAWRDIKASPLNRNLSLSWNFSDRIVVLS